MSPDGRYLASCVHLSRPKVPATICCLATGQTRTVPHEGDVDLCWSPDSKWLAWGRWIVDPNNDGTFVGLEVWITSPVDGASRKVGNGFSPRFAPDGRHLLYVQSPNYYQKGALMAADLNGRHRYRLTEQVSDGFAVWIRPK